MANLSDAVARVCEDYLVRPEDEVGAAVGREIQAAIDHYASERFGFNEVRLTFTLTATSVYSLPNILTSNEVRVERVTDGTTISYFEQYYGRIIEIDNVLVTHSSTRDYWLDPVTWSEMVALRSTPQLTGDPTKYVRYGDSLYVDASPTSTMTAYLDVHVEFVKLAEVSPQTNAFLDEGYELICARAARMVAMKTLREYDHAAQFAQLEQEALNTLRERGFRRMAGGRLVASL